MLCCQTFTANFCKKQQYGLYVIQGFQSPYFILHVNSRQMHISWYLLYQNGLGALLFYIYPYSTYFKYPKYKKTTPISEIALYLFCVTCHIHSLWNYIIYYGQEQGKEKDVCLVFSTTNRPPKTPKQCFFTSIDTLISVDMYEYIIT